jgi:hypothetical protein
VSYLTGRRPSSPTRKKLADVEREQSRAVAAYREAVRGERF